MTAARSPNPRSSDWTLTSAEALLSSLAGVVSARVVAKAGGEVEEIHLLTTSEVTPKQTVRNVESALLARFGLAVDHRKISVAQTNEPPAPRARTLARPDPRGPTEETAAAPGAEAEAATATMREPVAGSGTAERAVPSESRILFVGLQVETQRTEKVRFRVELEWQGERYLGEAQSADVPRARMEAVATACLRAIEAVIEGGGGARVDLALALDGVKTVHAFDRTFVIVAVHAMKGAQTSFLSGLASIEHSPDRGVILASLQAMDRWIRGRIVTNES